jgi:hypothetical protein
MDLAQVLADMERLIPICREKKGWHGLAGASAAQVPDRTTGIFCKRRTQNALPNGVKLLEAAAGKK